MDLSRPDRPFFSPGRKPLHYPLITYLLVSTGPPPLLLYPSIHPPTHRIDRFLSLLLPSPRTEKRREFVPSDKFLGNFPRNSRASLSCIVKGLNHRASRAPQPPPPHKRNDYPFLPPPLVSSQLKRR